MIDELEERVHRLEEGLKKAETVVEKRHFKAYLKARIKTFADELSFKDWMVIVVAVYLAACVGVLISKGLS